ncbi:RsfA family transcriptional regulator [Peribacillus alkalitolerans]|uniref:RsfA family transcriptional regulator n=1 Tax=Peribacillus alkalitolerans TaxID=1550385 RepID=UPI0013D210BC|nr:RsfA family transcriptional regulator [Peribacillus alkalitolerans]
MSMTRQDAWSQDEDLLLAEVVLRHIREGSTQLTAFEEVGKQLSRTSAACGFRWNSFVRKQYKSGIELAKKQRKEYKKKAYQKNQVQSKSEVNTKDAAVEVESTLKQAESTIQGDSLNLQNIVTYLNSFESLVSQKDQEKDKLQKELKILKEENFKLSRMNEELENKIHTIESEYRSILEILEKARKLVNKEDGKKVQKV